MNEDMNKPQATQSSLHSKLKFAAILLTVVCLGLFAFNQAFEWHYKAEFIAQPCGLCQKLNPNQSECVQGCFQVRTPINLYQVNFSYLQYNYNGTGPAKIS